MDLYVSNHYIKPFVYTCLYTCMFYRILRTMWIYVTGHVSKSYRYMVVWHFICRPYSLYQYVHRVRWLIRGGSVSVQARICVALNIVDVCSILWLNKFAALVNGSTKLARRHWIIGRFAPLKGIDRSGNQYISEFRWTDCTYNVGIYNTLYKHDDYRKWQIFACTLIQHTHIYINSFNIMCDKSLYIKFFDAQYCVWWI